jgi:ribosomal protein S27E
MKCEKCEKVELQITAASATATVYRCPGCGTTTTVPSSDKKKAKRTKPE